MIEKVRAKFNCTSIEKYQFGMTAKFMAVYGKEGENADFTKATPNGTLQIGISSDVPASEFFTPGKSYYLDFTPAE
jgi:hypothetical protein